MSDIWKHKKRGTTYEIVSNAAEVESSDLTEGEVVTVYRSTTTGQFHIRRRSEFHDGRFEKNPSLTDSHSARDEAERIVREHLDKAFSASFVTPVDQDLMSAIEIALLAYGRRERAQGMRDAIAVLREYESTECETAAHLLERRARETEGTK